MNTKTKKIIVIINTAMVTLMTAGGAIAKLIKVKPVVDDFTRLGVVKYTQLLGAAELLFLALLLYPKTMRIGYLLLFSYLAGAVATHLAHGEIAPQPFLPMIFITVLALLRDKSFILGSSEKYINQY